MQTAVESEAASQQRIQEVQTLRAEIAELNNQLTAEKSEHKETKTAKKALIVTGKG